MSHSSSHSVAKSLHGVAAGLKHIPADVGRMQVNTSNNTGYFESVQRVLVKSRWYKEHMKYLTSVLKNAKFCCFCWVFL